MQLRLVTNDGKANPGVIRVSDDEIAVGRERTDVRVRSVSDPTAISRKHARVGWDGCGVWVLDESTNGVMVNFVSVIKGQRSRLRVGDKVTFGNNTQELTYVLEDPSDTPSGAICSEVLLVDDVTQEVCSLHDMKRGQELLMESAADQELNPVSATTDPSSFLTPFSDNSGIASRVIAYLKGAYSRTTNSFTHTLPSAKLAEMILLLADRFHTHMAPRPLFLEDLPYPMYILGDLHGSFYDLQNYIDVLTPFGDVRYTAAPITFLGDFVDRGPASVEVVMYLFALKLLAPENVILLRGNHEDEVVNGDLELMGDLCFLGQCRQLLGSYGDKVWKGIGRGFSVLPVCGIIGERVFVCHGGVPRGDINQLKRVGFPRLASVLDSDTEDVRLVRDLLWSDPAEESPETSPGAHHLPSERCEDGSVVNFTNSALTEFLAAHNLSLVIRAHQYQPKGLRLAKHGRVLTVFSTTTYQPGTSAGIVLVTPGCTVKLISYSPPAEQKKQCHSPATFNNSFTFASLRSSQQLDLVG